MKASVFALGAIATVAMAQDRNELPACGVSGFPNPTGVRTCEFEEES